MAVIDLTLERDGAGWKVVDRASQSVSIADYEADPAMLELLERYDLRAREDVKRVIGRLEGGAGYMACKLLTKEIIHVP